MEKFGNTVIGEKSGPCANLGKIRYFNKDSVVFVLKKKKMWVPKKKVTKPILVVSISHQDFSGSATITFGSIEDEVDFPIKDKGKKVVEDYCGNIEIGKVDTKDKKNQHVLCIGKEEGRMAWKGQDGGYIERKEKDINELREKVVLKPFRIVAHRRPGAVKHRIPLEEQCLPLVVLNNDGSENQIIFSNSKSVTFSFGDNLDAWSEDEVEFVQPLDVMQPPPDDQLPLILAWVNGNPGVDKQFEDTDAEYMEMVAVMGVSFNAANGEVLAMIKDNVETPANNVADGEELFNDVLRQQTISKKLRGMKKMSLQILLYLMVLSSQ
ncbi:hypothetical protein AMTR_s00047p00179600 [Amborella trichopoda]|uniref:Uncharacterized protein n=1 Tax=Amborella trichopoda TaxID=13333 RepID=U5D6E8_AMBTC|nr:hypothetical protein AMTR_s00047p00179600 [Amborella trichopoda]